MTWGDAGFLLLHMRFWVVLASLTMAAACGCGRKQSQVAPAGSGQTGLSTKQVAGTGEKLIVTPDNSLEGKIVRWNGAGRFVVINFPIGHLPAIEQRLVVYRMGLKVGEVKVTGPQVDDIVVADVTSGEAAEGDVVRDK